MKPLFISLLLVCTCTTMNAQLLPLPKGFTPEEKAQLERGDFQISTPERGIASPPPFESIRGMAEWEEIQALTIAWTSYPGILKQIVAAAKDQCEVIILSENPSQTETYLLGAQGAPALPDLNNVTILEAAYNSIWMRDYAGNPAYANEVDDLFMVDWIYNRPNRPDDNASPQVIADYLGLDLYTMTEAPTDLVNTGGNWMTDGFGTAFASELILEENEPGNPYGVTPKTNEEIDQIVQDFLGVHTYIKMTALEYDNINHIDMHMKLLDEQTILIGEYPEGIADGPQINANIEYVLSNYQTKWGTPFQIVRIPMPDSPSGLWPSSDPASFYRTYTNSVFVNNKIILPTYREEYDTTAIRIYQETMPGYEIIPIDCDNSAETIIAASGAIHCITHSVGVQGPLLISHLPLSDTEDDINPYEVVAYMNHRDGISNASLFWKTSLTGEYAEVAMAEAGEGNWSGLIPAQPVGTTIYYYVRGEATTGKVQVRPMPAPDGYWSFSILDDTVGVGIAAQNDDSVFGNIFPNPAGAITCIPLILGRATEGQLEMLDMTGRQVHVVRTGTFPPGESRYFFDASLFASGVYQVVFRTADGAAAQPVMIR